MLDQTKVLFKLSAFFDVKDRGVPTHFNVTTKVPAEDARQLILMFPKLVNLKAARDGTVSLFGDLREPLLIAGVRKYHGFRRAAERLGFRIEYVHPASNAYRDEDAFESAVVGPRELLRIRGAALKQLDIVHFHSGIAWRIEAIGDQGRTRKAKVRYLKYDHDSDKIGKRKDWTFSAQTVFAVTRRKTTH